MTRPVDLAPTKIVAVHLSYPSRVEEYAAQTPDDPSYFLKPPTTLARHGDEVVRPRGCRYLNYEGEVAVIVGRRMKRVPEDAPSITWPATRPRTTSASTTSATPTAARCFA